MATRHSVRCALQSRSENSESAHHVFLLHFLSQKPCLINLSPQQRTCVESWLITYVQTVASFIRRKTLATYTQKRLIHTKTKGRKSEKPQSLTITSLLAHKTATTWWNNAHWYHPGNARLTWPQMLTIRNHHRKEVIVTMMCHPLGRRMSPQFRFKHFLFNIHNPPQ